MAQDPAKPASSWRKRVLAWGLALLALTFVATVVPLRDRCVDPLAVPGQHGQVAVTRDAAGCLVHRAEGAARDARISAAECDRLKCEPGLLTSLSGARISVLVGLLGLYLTG